MKQIINVNPKQKNKERFAVIYKVQGTEHRALFDNTEDAKVFGALLEDYNHDVKYLYI